MFLSRLKFNNGRGKAIMTLLIGSDSAVQIGSERWNSGVREKDQLIDTNV